MDFMTAAKTGFNKITDMDGKATRPEFWWYALAVIIVWIITAFVLKLFLSTYMASAVAEIAAIVLIYSAAVRRLNDAGKPRLWAQITFGIGIVFAIALLVPPLVIVMPIMGIAYLALSIILIYFLVQPGAGAVTAE